MSRTGVWIGKCLPPHRGHLTGILSAYTQCDELYVIVSERRDTDVDFCMNSCFKKYIPGTLRKQWLSQELKDMDNIHVLLLDETHLPPPPNAWEAYIDLVKKIVPKKIDVIFGGDKEYIPFYKKYFPEGEYVLLDRTIDRWPISGTELRNNLYDNWNYIVGSARPFFAKKVLIAGTESCGKTTLTKALAKIYNTSWSEEVGRYYAGRYLGGDETIFTEEDFKRITHLQYESDFEAFRTANMVSFCDTDAVITQYYAKQYLGKYLDVIDEYIDPNKFDIILFLVPDVPWIADGQRRNGDQISRDALNRELYSMYVKYGFNTENIHIVTGSYSDRLRTAINVVDNFLGRK